LNTNYGEKGLESIDTVSAAVASQPAIWRKVKTKSPDFSNETICHK
jgi:hypothetical protein